MVRQPVTTAQVVLTLLVCVVLYVIGLSLTGTDFTLQNLFSAEGLARLAAFYPFLWISICLIPPAWLATRRGAESDGEPSSKDEAAEIVASAPQIVEVVEEEEAENSGNETEEESGPLVVPKTPDQMNVKELQTALKSRGISPWKVRKTVLIRKLKEELDREAGN